MKRENEFTVGVVVIVAFAVIVAGALWLSGTHNFGWCKATRRTVLRREILRKLLG